MNVKLDQISEVGSYREGMNWNTVEKIIMERRSIRAFKKEPLPESMIRRILEAGRFAPSAGNMQPWRFTVINDPVIIEEMERDAVKVAKFFMFFMDYTSGGFLRRILTKPVAKIAIRLRQNELHAPPFFALSMIAQGKTTVFHGAPTIVLLIEDRRGVSCPAIDIGVCGQNMVLAAHSLGVGSCWIGLIKLLMYLPKWRKRFKIKYPYHLGECIAFGWQKFKADRIVEREKQIIEWYDKGSNYKSRFEVQG